MSRFSLPARVASFSPSTKTASPLRTVTVKPPLQKSSSRVACAQKSPSSNGKTTKTSPYSSGQSTSPSLLSSKLKALQPQYRQHSPYEVMARVGGWGSYTTILLPDTDEGHSIAGWLMLDSVPLTPIFVNQGMELREDTLMWADDSYRVDWKYGKTPTGQPCWVGVVSLKHTCLE